MKKLKLDLQQLNAEVLTRSQMKTIFGGLASGGTCAYYLPDGSASGGPIVTYNVSSQEAQEYANAWGAGAHWCCDSCGTASWYGI